MEVHHHPNVHHKSKKFKEYFLEFLMIFLAVSMGFFAESIRENISNNEHAKLLTEQLVKDLKKDTTNLQHSINFEKIQKKKIDTLFFELQKPIGLANTKAIQQLVSDSYAVILFHASTGAITAIEKELNIKQFANSELPVMLADYENKTSINKALDDLLFKLLQENLEPFMYAHFTPLNAYNLFSKDSLATDNKMRNQKQEDMTELSVRIENVSGITSNLIQWEEVLKKQAVEMIKYTTEKYQLEK
ncbi:MAG TPA: hypothetical protein VIH86_01440 [Puia sp.]|jgi:hypothetical protein